ncbi:MAG: hypothetical protein CFH41_01654 [Alphaproteobacteria bacterium MarineAlpha11_Bin1]|nr:MAG: hypothetical protein CFH41_01654 [Alphaproteobacteria bacterium MarineAlpha11_Bin1]
MKSISVGNIKLVTHSKRAHSSRRKQRGPEKQEPGDYNEDKCGGVYVKKEYKWSIRSVFEFLKEIEHTLQNELCRHLIDDPGAAFAGYVLRNQVAFYCLCRHAFVPVPDR